MATNEIPITKKLKEIYEEAYVMYYDFENCTEPTNNHDVQIKVKKCIGLFEDCTKLVSLAGIFSRNENYSEIATSDLQYLLLPFFLGQLTQKITGPAANRKDLVEISDIYFKDFLQRCSDYELCENSVISSSSANGGEESSTAVVALEKKSEMAMLMDQARSRNAKMEAYRQRSELNKQIEQMRVLMKQEHVEDDVKREFYLKLIKSSIYEAEESLALIKEELKILDYMKNISSSDGGSAAGSGPPARPKHYSSAKLKPIIITRDVAQKTVYGLGYPSIPTMTVDEFYDERVREGIFPDPCHAKPAPRPEPTSEDEAIEDEQKMEADDEEHLARRRRMDEFKDDVRRGDGNRYNRS